jgi:hypothetical protein
VIGLGRTSSRQALLFLKKKKQKDFFNLRHGFWNIRHPWRWPGGKVNLASGLNKIAAWPIALSPRPVRLEAQDTALSRRRQGFESPTGRHARLKLGTIHWLAATH